ncbi:hypothetical protein chiPu_0030233, partial [Chiloscyllium punctatum]|nr:hypothetical protein [Chiloscyllium punctatum]
MDAIVADAGDGVVLDQRGQAAIAGGADEDAVGIRVHLSGADLIAGDRAGHGAVVLALGNEDARGVEGVGAAVGQDVVRDVERGGRGGDVAAGSAGNMDRRSAARNDGFAVV